MELTDAKKRTVTRKTKPRKPGERERWYTDAQKLEVVKCWLITGNLTQTAAAMNINVETVRTWRKSEWWKQLVADIKSENSIQLTSKLKRIANKALDLTEDRLDNGDFIFNNKTGEIERKPVSLKDTHKVAVELTKQALETEKHPQELENAEKTKDSLAKLADEFAKFTKNHARPAIEVTDVVFSKETTDEKV